MKTTALVVSTIALIFNLVMFYGIVIQPMLGR
jgi:hypothetical protein